MPEINQKLTKLKEERKVPGCLEVRVFEEKCNYERLETFQRKVQILSYNLLFNLDQVSDFWKKYKN